MASRKHIEDCLSTKSGDITTTYIYINVYIYIFIVWISMGFTGYITKVHKQIAVYASYGQLYRKHFDKSWALKYTFRPLCRWLSLAKSPVGESVGPVGQKKKSSSRVSSKKKLCNITHRIHVWYNASIGGILMVNVTIYSIHGSYGSEQQLLTSIS